MKCLWTLIEIMKCVWIKKKKSFATYFLFSSIPWNSKAEGIVASYQEKSPQSVYVRFLVLPLKAWILVSFKTEFPVWGTSVIAYGHCHLHFKWIYIWNVCEHRKIMKCMWTHGKIMKYVWTQAKSMKYVTQVKFPFPCH